MPLRKSFAAGIDRSDFVSSRSPPESGGLAKIAKRSPIASTEFDLNAVCVRERVTVDHKVKTWYRIRIQSFVVARIPRAATKPNACRQNELEEKWWRVFSAMQIADNID